MRKYDVRFCNCGRVHFIENEKLEKVCNEQDKEILFICGHCGATTRIGLDDYIDEGKAWYGISVNDFEITDVSKIGLIVHSRGEQIRMETGGEATYHGDTFIDWETPKPENVDAIEWEKKRRIVNTQHTINWIRNDDKLDALSCYAVKIDWIGTKFEKDFHKMF
jgi:hypothetical protein